MSAQGEVAFREHLLDELFGPTRDGEQQPLRGRSLAANFQTGDRVLMHGLCRAELNGRYAIVQDPRPVRERYHLRLEDTGAEIRARNKNFTKILVKPSEAVDLEDGDVVDTSTLLHGTCCICLSEKASQAVIPCGHMALCDACSRRPHSTCPICRRRVFSLLRVYTPGGTGEEELEKAIVRCRAAEKRASDLEACQERPQKRVKQEGGPKREKGKSSARAPEVGFWVRLPTLSARSLETLLSPGDVEYSQLFGQVVAVQGTTCMVRFRGVEEKAFVEEGRKRPSAEYRDVELPLELQFQALYDPEEAEWSIATQDRYCTFASMKAARKKKLRVERRAEEKKAYSPGSASDVL